MKKFLLSVVAFAMSFTISNAQNVKSDWANLCGTVSDTGSKGQSMVDHYAVNGNGEIFYSYVFYTAEGYDYAQYGNSDKFYGFPGSVKPNGNLNFGMNKIDSDGNLLMAVYSDRGYYDKGSCFMAPTPDGGVVLTLKARVADEAVDPDGKETLLRLHTTADTAYTYTIEEPGILKIGGWQNRAYILKLDKDGKVEWKKNITWESTPTEDKKSRSNMLAFGGIEVGADGNIYTCGVFASPMTIEGNEKVYQPVIPANWDYDFVQNTAGSNFLAQFDMEGNCKWVMTSDKSRTLQSAKAMSMASDDEAVYMYGKLEGSANQVEKFGGKTLTQYNDKMSQYVMKINYTDNANATDETAVVEYATVLHTSAGGLKPMQINLGDEVIALTGGAKKTKFVDNTGKELLDVPQSAYLGYIVTLNKKTGEYTNSSLIPNLFESEGAHVFNDSIYVSGYAMGGWGRFVTMGHDLKTVNSYDVIKSSGFLTNQGSVMVGNKVVMFNRSRTDFDLLGLGKLTARQNWDILVNGFTLPFFVDKTPLELSDEVNYTATADKEYTVASYVRNFENTEWQSLYLPFGLDYADWNADFDVARINDVHQFDNDGDGQIDDTQLEVIILAEGSKTEANVPYLIKAKAAGEYTLSAKDVLAKAAAPYQHDMTSWNTRFIVNGTYEGVAAQDMFDKKFFALENGVLNQAAEPTALKGYRWYLSVEDRAGNQDSSIKSISLRIVDENGNITGVDEIEMSQSNGSVWPADIYNLQGKKVKANANSLQGLPKGVYIVNGKKVIL